MTTSSRTHSIQWSPHEGHNQFLVGSNDLRLYECIEDDEGKTQMSLLAVNSDLPLMKCFDWSPDPNYTDLVAVGFTNGRTILVRMHAVSPFYVPESSPFPPIDAFLSSTSTLSGTVPSSQLAGHTMYSQPSTPRGPHPGTSTPSNPSYLALNVRHSRACNVVSFCPAEPHLLATGLDKVRNEVSLMVWDVSQAQGKPSDHTGLGGFSSPGTVPATPVMSIPPGLAGATAGVFAHVKVPSVSGWADRPPLPPGEGLGAKAPGPALDLGGEGFFSERSRFSSDGAEYMTPRVNPPTPSHRTNDEPRPIQQYGNSEAITSCAWFPTGSPRLVAGMAMKFVRIYDLRVEGPNSPILFPTKAVYGINVDPFHPHRFASYTEEGIVKIWDLSMLIHVLTITAEMTNPNARATAAPGLSRISFSPTRSGLLATLSKESRVVRLWDIQEGVSRAFLANSQVTNASSSSATQRAPSITSAAGGITNPPSPFTNTVPGVATPSGMGYPGLSPGAVGTVLVGPGVVGGVEMERGASNAGSGVSVDSNSGEEDAFDTPVLWKSRKTQPSIKALSSFAWMPHSSNHAANASVHRLISVNKEGIIEPVRLQEALKFSWEPTGGLTLTGGGSLELHSAYHSSTASAIPNNSGQAPTGGGSINGETQLIHQRSALRKQGLPMSRGVNGTPLLRITSQQQDSNYLGMGTSFQTNSTETTDNSGGEPTPLVRNGVVYHRPGELQQRRATASTALGKPVHLGMGRARQGARRSDRAAADDAIISVEDTALIRELQMDVSVVMRERALRDYSMDCVENQAKVKYHRKLRELWSWMAQFEHLASESRAHIGAADYSFQGIHTVWMGPNAASQAYKKGSPLSTPKTSSPLARQSAYQPTHTNLTMQESTSSSSSTGTPASLSASSSLDHSTTAAIAALNLSRGTNVSPDDELAIVPTAHLAQRRLALWMCGFGFTKSELESELVSLESDGDFEKAAGWALFNGLTERAIKALNNSTDQRRKLMSAALAGYQNNTNQSQDGDGDTLWQSLARSLVDDLTDEPYLRTMFAYLASGDWHVVLEENELSSRERMAVALRVLSDDELTLYIEKLVRQMVTSGDIEGVFLTGLTKEGVDLFEQYVNSTGDIQTAALVLSFCVPKKFQDKRVEEWVDNYRSLLDRWQLYHTRAHFDIARGKHLGSTPGAAAEITPPQIYLRCSFCAQSLTHNLQIQNVKAKDGRRITVSTNMNPSAGMKAATKQKSTVCPSCSKLLPRCALCLLHMGTPTDPLRQMMATSGVQSDPSGFDLWFTWCQSCHHGGHAIHMREWFERHRQCPVSNCTCTCQY